MTDQLRSELLKLRSTRTTAALLLSGVALTLLSVIAQGLSLKLPALAGEDKQRALFGSATGMLLFATYVGAIAFTSEFRYGTIRPTLTFQPRRRLVLEAKLASAALAGLVFAAVGVAVSFAAGALILYSRHVSFAVGAGHVGALVAGTLAGGALCSMLGVAVGALVRNQVGAIVALAAWSLAVETVLFTTLPSIGRYLPGQASDGLAGLPTVHLLSPLAGAVVLAAWTITLAAVGDRRTNAGDIAS
jgi:ABC-2 type transport system permease protein